ncbi:hypothetical protein L6452_05515 [Arctium lappa]|uniref:Uncharacterized protein n=1 Tax=Arctium lappa TaxID=4217 RepID=A0ACB9EGA4_ARCLA|nr:hypothetical protein L6452_05515 [Arctium lappa]
MFLDSTTQHLDYTYTLAYGLRGEIVHERFRSGVIDIICRSISRYRSILLNKYSDSDSVTLRLCSEEGVLEQVVETTKAWNSSSELGVSGVVLDEMMKSKVDRDKSGSNATFNFKVF